MIVFLLSSQADYITGATIDATGGIDVPDGDFNGKDIVSVRTSGNISRRDGNLTQRNKHFICKMTGESVNRNILMDQPPMSQTLNGQYHLWVHLSTIGLHNI